MPKLTHSSLEQAIKEAETTINNDRKDDKSRREQSNAKKLKNLRHLIFPKKI